MDAGDPDSLENEEPLSPKGPEERIVRNPEQAYLAVCLGVKDQHLDLREWIEYHQRLGVGKFYIFDDNSSVPVSEELQDLIKEGWPLLKSGLCSNGLTTCMLDLQQPQPELCLQVAQCLQVLCQQSSSSVDTGQWDSCDAHMAAKVPCAPRVCMCDHEKAAVRKLGALTLL